MFAVRNWQTHPLSLLLEAVSRVTNVVMEFRVLSRLFWPIDK